MISIDEIEKTLAPYKGQLLDYAQLAVTESQFKAFRKLILDALGKKGFISDLDRLMEKASSSQERTGQGRNRLRKKGGVP